MIVMTPHVMFAALRLMNSYPRIKVGLFCSVTGCAALNYVLWCAFQYWRSRKRVAGRKKKAQGRKKLIQDECKNAVCDDILTKHIDDLLKDLKSGKLTAEQVLQAFQKKALDVDSSVNAITEPLTEALDEAKRLDSASTKDELLHGIPISLKENIGIHGYDSTGGMAYFINQIAKDDSVVVKVLKHHGAIPFVRTNIPQTMMSLCSSNPIYGETSNPHDQTRGPGGSSSGEGALIGGGGSIMGIGTDVGGSIRVPAAFCGCYSLKPTAKRVSYKGLLNVSKGQLAINSSVCPIARDLTSLVYLSKSLMSEVMYELDPELPPVPFNQEILDKTDSMRIGYYTFDGNVKCQPAVVRAVLESKAALEKMGHTLVPIEIPEMCPPGFNIGQMIARVAIADRFKAFKGILSFDKHEKSVKFAYSTFMFPPWIVKILSFVLSFKDKFASELASGTCGFGSVAEYQAHLKDFKNWQEQFLESWLERKLDAVICPTFPSPAPKKSNMHMLTAAGLYCQLYNGLNYPSGVLPITKVTKEDVEQTMDPSIFKPSLIIEKLLMKGVEGSEGMPIGIQCVALPYRDEICLRVMKEVEKGLQKPV